MGILLLPLIPGASSCFYGVPLSLDIQLGLAYLSYPGDSRVVSELEEDKEESAFSTHGHSELGLGWGEQSSWFRLKLTAEAYLQP